MEEVEVEVEICPAFAACCILSSCRVVSLMVHAKPNTMGGYKLSMYRVAAIPGRSSFNIS